MLGGIKEVGFYVSQRRHHNHLALLGVGALAKAPLIVVGALVKAALIEVGALAKAALIEVGFYVSQRRHHNHLTLLVAGALAKAAPIEVGS